MVDKEAAIELVAKYLTQQFVEAARSGSVSVSDQWPYKIYGHSDEPVWTVSMPSDSRVGASRVLVISRVTGAVLFDGFAGE